MEYSLDFEDSSQRHGERDRKLHRRGCGWCTSDRHCIFHLISFSLETLHFSFSQSKKMWMPCKSIAIGIEERTWWCSWWECIPLSTPSFHLLRHANLSEMLILWNMSHTSCKQRNGGNLCTMTIKEEAWSLLVYLRAGFIAQMLLFLQYIVFSALYIELLLWVNDHS